MALPKSIQTFRSSGATLSASNPNRDGTGTIVTVITGVAAGSVIQSVNMAAVGDTTAGYIRFFLYDGSNYFFLWDWPVPNRMPNVGPPPVPPWSDVWRGSLLLPSASWSLRMATHNAETFKIMAQGGDY